MNCRLLIISAIMSLNSVSAFAQEAAPQGSLMGSLFPIILIVIIFYFLIIRPQSKKVNEHKQMIESLKRGDKVITAGGVEGKIARIDDSTGMVELEVAPSIKIKVVKATLTGISSRTVGEAQKTVEKK